MGRNLEVMVLFTIVGLRGTSVRAADVSGTTVNFEDYGRVDWWDDWSTPTSVVGLSPLSKRTWPPSVCARIGEKGGLPVGSWVLGVSVDGAGVEAAISIPTVCG